MYTETQLVGIAKRENNSKRPYLVLNKEQGKHMPVSPKRAFAMFDALAEKLETAYKGESLLLIGFAETATAIGARLSIRLHTDYIQTTRERMDGVSWLIFSETHSHATEQKLVREDVEAALERTDRIVFVEDEVTTGNTILHIINLLKETFQKKPCFSVASLLNGMDQDAVKRFADQGISLHYLVKTNHEHYARTAELFLGDGRYAPPDALDRADVPVICVPYYKNARRRVAGDFYDEACRRLWERMEAEISWEGSKNILLLGTEECMYPAMFVGACLEERGNAVFCHATTRSPIAVSREDAYPLHERHELISLYDENRKTFLYDLKAYDAAWILTDAEDLCEKGVNTLINALRSCGNRNIQLFRWCQL